MKIKSNNIEFISFSDGICNIYSEDEEGNRVYKHKSLCFSNKILGYKRYFAARTAKVQTDMVIKVPNIGEIDNYDILSIDGIGCYSIEMIQVISTSNPPSKDLTLRKL